MRGLRLGILCSQLIKLYMESIKPKHIHQRKTKLTNTTTRLKHISYLTLSPPFFEDAIFDFLMRLTHVCWKKGYCNFLTLKWRFRTHFISEAKYFGTTITMSFWNTQSCLQCSTRPTYNTTLNDPIFSLLTSNVHHYTNSFYSFFFFLF